MTAADSTPVGAVHRPIADTGPLTGSADAPDAKERRRTSQVLPRRYHRDAGNLAARALVLNRAGHMERGAFIIREGRRRNLYGQTEPGEAVPEIQVLIGASWRRLLGSGSAGLAETYACDGWDCASLDELTLLLRIILRNFATGVDRSRPSTRVQSVLRTAARRSRTRVPAEMTPLLRSRRPPMDEEFLSSFLDRTLSFTSGLFTSARDSLEHAQEAKFARLADQLRLDAADHLLEIGTGFGGFAIYAASERGCKVTASLLSPEHHAQVQRRVRSAGVEDLVTVTTAPFSEVTGHYDKIAAIESLEQLDRQRQRLFFPAVAKLLTDHGVAALQTTLAAGTAPAHRHRVLRRYGFALGDPLSIDALASDAIGTAALGLIDFTDLTPHAVATTRRWREGYPATSPNASPMERRFDRLFRFVLCYTEALYAERRSTLCEYTLVAPGWRPTGLGLH